MSATPVKKRPLTVAQAQVAYAKLGVDELLVLCRQRLPGFTVSLHAWPTGQVMMTWSYALYQSPMWEWQRSRPPEVHMGGTYNSLRECLVTILNRVDRFDTWTWEQGQLAERQERAARAAAAAPIEKPMPDIDEGEEPAVPAEPLPEVKPLPQDPLADLQPVAAGPDRLI